MDNNGSRPRTRSSAARSAAAAAAVSSRTRGNLARAGGSSPALLRSSRRRTRSSAARALASPATATPPSMSEPPAPPVTSAPGSAVAFLPEASRRRELTFSHPQTPSTRSARQDNIQSEGLKTPTTSTGGECAICLSPLKRGNQPQQPQPPQQEIYRVHGCGHTFHRACLVESRRAGNRGCPCCRGELEQGLTPEPTTAENTAAAERRAVSAARGRALDMAVASMLEVRELLAAVSDASAAGVAATTELATNAASSTQAAVAGVLTVVRSPAPSLAMYETASTALRRARGQLRRTKLTLVVVEARELRSAAQDAVVAAERKVWETRRATRTTPRTAAAATAPRGSAESMAAALRGAEEARASLASIRAREADAEREVAWFDELVGLEGLVDGGGSSGGNA
eukprot:g20379.t1